MIEHKSKENLNRREFLKRSTIAAAAIGAGLNVRPLYAARKKQALIGKGKKVIVLGLDGMDPILSERMIKAGKLPNFAKLSKQGSFKVLGTSIPPQSPVAWANFINGAATPTDRWPPSFQLPKQLRAKVIGKQEITSCNWIFGLSTINQPRPYCYDRGCRFGIILIKRVFARSFTICPRTIHRVHQNMVTIGVCQVWAPPTCWGHTERISTMLKMGQFVQ